jgi:hypothetical protein
MSILGRDETVQTIKIRGYELTIIRAFRVSCIGGGNRIDNSKCFDKIYAKYAVGKT